MSKPPGGAACGDERAPVVAGDPGTRSAAVSGQITACTLSKPGRRGAEPQMLRDVAVAMRAGQLLPLIDIALDQAQRVTGCVDRARSDRRFGAAARRRTRKAHAMHERHAGSGARQSRADRRGPSATAAPHSRIVTKLRPQAPHSAADCIIGSVDAPDIGREIPGKPVNRWPRSHSAMVQAAASSSTRASGGASRCQRRQRPRAPERAP